MGVSLFFFVLHKKLDGSISKVDIGMVSIELISLSWASLNALGFLFAKLRVRPMVLKIHGVERFQ